MKRFAAVLAVSALLLGACGGDDGGAPEASADAKTTLTTALDSLAASGGQTITFSIQSDVGSLQALAADDGSELTEEDAQKILGSSISISSKPGDDPATSAAQFIVNIAGNPAIELRTIGYDLYVHADVAGLMETLGQDPASLDALAQQAAAGGFGFLKDAIDGKWLALRGLDQLAETLTGQPVGQPTEQQQQVMEKLVAVLKESSSVGSEGEDDIGEHLVATFPLRQTYEAALEALSGLGGALPTTGLPPASEVPDESITVDMWVKDGRLVQVVFDFIQVGQISGEEAPEGVEELAARISLAEFTGTVEAPADAVEVDLQQIMGMFMGGMTGGDMAGGGGGSGGGDGFPCEMIKDEPQEVQDQFANECPEYQKKK